MENTLESVKEYYGKVLSNKSDLPTNASKDALPPYLKKIIPEIHPEVLNRFYGCGSPIPMALEGCRVLDLGCGTGRDSFIVSKLVGTTGEVVGVDMDEKQLAIARRHIDYHTNRYRYEKSNVKFLKGYIEDLKALDIEENSFDVVISNGVINLSPQKEEVFDEIFRVLKPGGELHFSDIFSDRRVPSSRQKDPVILGERLGGAMYINDFRRLLQKYNCYDHRIMQSRPITINNPEVENKVGMIKFSSLTIRAFKLDLEDIPEDYGHAAYYIGTMTRAPHAFILDDQHIFPREKPVLICGNTAKILEGTRFSKHFRIEGNFSTHYGPFPYEPSASELKS